MSDLNFLKHEIVFNPTGNEFDKARDQLLGIYKLVKIEDWEYKFIKQSKLSIPKKIAELLDTSNGDWGNVEIEELDYWIFPNIPDGKESYRSASCEVYLAGKALGVELVEVEG